MYSMSIFGPAAVTAARPGLEPAAWWSVDGVEANWDDDDDDDDDIDIP